MMEQVPDHPVIRSMERTGEPAGVRAGPRHCEPVTDVTGVAIRVPRRRGKENGLPRHDFSPSRKSADWLAMTEHPHPGAPHGT